MPIAAIVFLVLLVLAILVFAPLICIWSLNTLFGLKIAYTLSTWAAAFILSTTIGGTRYVNKK